MKAYLYHVALTALLLSAAFTMGCDFQAQVESEPTQPTAEIEYGEQALTLTLKENPTYIVEWREQYLTDTYHSSNVEREEFKDLSEGMDFLRRIRRQKSDRYGTRGWNVNARILAVFEMEEDR